VSHGSDRHGPNVLHAVPMHGLRSLVRTPVGWHLAGG
jgi:hypothetical protein